MGTPGVISRRSWSGGTIRMWPRSTQRLKTARKLQGWKWADRGSARKCSGQVTSLLLEMGQQPPRHEIAGVLESADEQISGQPCKDGGASRLRLAQTSQNALGTGQQHSQGVRVCGAHPWPVRGMTHDCDCDSKKIWKGKKKKRPRPKVRVRVQGCGAH